MGSGTSLALAFMLWPRQMRLVLVLSALLSALMPVLLAQDDPNDVPLGDVARSLRKKTPPPQNVIDDDNLPQVMELSEGRYRQSSALRYLMTSESKGFRVSAPDVTCSFSFTATAKSLLASSQYSQMDLPPDDVAKLEGPATIEGDTLIVAVLNRTDWHVSELAVALTIVKKGGLRDASLENTESEVRPEKRPDVTMIYRMRAAAPPSMTTVFSTRLNLELAPDEEWHWAIVQAKGYPPASRPVSPLQATAQTETPLPAQPTSTPSSATQDSTAASLPQVPQ